MLQCTNSMKREETISTVILTGRAVYRLAICTMVELSVAGIRVISVTVARHRAMVQIQFDSVDPDQKENSLKVQDMKKQEKGK